MAFKLGDKRTNPLKSRGFMNTSPFTSSGNTMAYAKGEPEGDDKKPVKTQAQLDAEARKKAQDNMTVVKTETKKEDGGTRTTEYLEGEGKSTGFSKDPVERAKQDKWIEDNPKLYLKLLAKQKETDQRITFKPDGTPEDIPKSQPNPTQDAGVKADQIGTNLTTENVDKGDQIQGGMEPVEEVYYEMGYNPATDKNERIRKTRTVYKKVDNTKATIEAQKREATKEKTDDTVVIGSTGDEDTVNQAVEEQLQAKNNNANNIINNE